MIEQDLQLRFGYSIVTPQIVCDAIADKHDLTQDEASMFSMWVISKDLELQMRPDQDLFALMVLWNNWVLKYTHFPESQDPKHAVNHNWFVYRRTASLSLEKEIANSNERTLKLLFGEVIMLIG